MGKLKLNKDSLKGIFINHVEKMLLGVVLLVFVVFVYHSVGLEGIPADRTPDKLLQSAQSAEKNILNPDNAKGVIEPIKETVRTGYPQRVNVPATQADVYLASKPLAPSYVPPGAKRVDPELFPPEKPEVVAISAPVAFRPTKPGGEEDLLAKEKNSAHPPKPVVKKKAQPNNAYGGYGEEYGMAGMDSDAGMPGTESDEYGMPGMGGMMSGMGIGGMPGMGGTVDPNAIVASAADRVGYLAPPGAIAKTQHCIAVKFVVPWRKQWEEYQAKLSTAQEYNPARDIPNYLSFTAERVEVSDDPAAPVDWTKAVMIAYTGKTKPEMLKAGYAAFAQEVADPRYLHLGVLTFPMPPFINRDLEKIGLHSEVPKLAAAMMKAPPTDQKKAEETEKKEGDASDLPNDLPGQAVGGSYAGSSGMMPGMSGSMPGMSGSMPGMSGSMPGMSGMMPGMSGMMPGMSEEGESAGVGGMGEGMMSGYGMAGYGMSDYGNEDVYGGMSVAVPGPSVPYLLIRFFDFTVEPGKKYRYRVQTLLEDPNRPVVPQLEPSERSLDPEVKVRLAGVATEEQEKKRRLPFRRTEFSEPSEPIGIEIEPRVLAGKIELQKLGAQLDKSQPKLALSEPQAKMLAVMWDDLRAVEVAAASDVFRGTFLNFVGKGDAIHPVMLVYKMLENYGFTTDRLVADIRGGDELAGAEKENPLVAPGEYALINAAGELVVRTEFDDWQAYRRLALPEPPAEPTVPAYGSGGMDAEGGMMPGMGYPGTGNKGRGRSSRGASSS